MQSQPEQISSSEFVIHGSNSTKLLKLLKPYGQLMPIQGQKDTYIVRLASPASNARHGWEKLRKAIGSEGQVLPVFLDDDEHAKYSVGTLQVRFPNAPSDDELNAWLPAGLRVKARNEYVPAQVALELAEPGQRFLPDLISELREQNGQEVKVWPETLQMFRRA